MLLAQATSVAVSPLAIQIGASALFLVLGSLLGIVVNDVRHRQQACEERDKLQTAELAKHAQELALSRQEQGQLKEQFAATRRTNDILQMQTEALKELLAVLRSKH